jgi:hypothetical protein
MNIHNFSRLAGVMTAACIVLTGCASPSDDSGATHHIRLSDTLGSPGESRFTVVSDTRPGQRRSAWIIAMKCFRESAHGSN